MHTWQGRQKKQRFIPHVFRVLALFFYVKESHYEIKRRRNFWKQSFR